MLSREVGGFLTSGRGDRGRTSSSARSAVGGICSLSLSLLEPAALVLTVRELCASVVGEASNAISFFLENEEMDFGLRTLSTGTVVDQRAFEMALPCLGEEICCWGDRLPGGAKGVTSSLFMGAVIHREQDASPLVVCLRLDRLFFATSNGTSALKSAHSGPFVPTSMLLIQSTIYFSGCVC